MTTNWISWDLLAKLRALLEQHRAEWSLAGPDKCHSGLALGCLARWVDVGYEDEALLKELLARFPANQRRPLPLADYVELRMAEALVAMREENLTKALHHLDTALLLSTEIEAPEVTVTASLWKARCLRKAGEYDHALDVTRQG